jgi:hypothetical protein
LLPPRHAKPLLPLPRSRTRKKTLALLGFRGARENTSGVPNYSFYSRKRLHSCIHFSGIRGLAMDLAAPSSSQVPLHSRGTPRSAAASPRLARKSSRTTSDTDDESQDRVAGLSGGGSSGRPPLPPKTAASGALRRKTSYGSSVGGGGSSLGQRSVGGSSVGSGTHRSRNGEGSEAATSVDFNQGQAGDDPLGKERHAPRGPPLNTPLLKRIGTLCTNAWSFIGNSKAQHGGLRYYSPRGLRFGGNGNQTR